MRLYLTTIERFSDTAPALLDAQRAEEYAKAKNGRRRQEMMRHCLSFTSTSTTPSVTAALPPTFVPPTPEPERGYKTVYA